MWPALLLQLSSPPGSAVAARLSWNAPAECPAPALDDAVRKLGAHGLADASIDVVIERRGPLLHESIQITVGSGPAEERELEAERCQELHAATILLVAIALDPVEVAATVETRVGPREPPKVPMPPGPTPAATLEVIEPLPPTTPATTSRPISWHLDTSVAAGAVAGVVPGVGGALRGSVGLTRARRIGSRLRLELVGTMVFPKRTTYADRPQIGARIDLWAAGTRACFEPTGARWAVSLCSGVEAGRLRARGFGTADAHTEASAWVAATLGAAVRVRVLGPLLLAGGLDSSVPLRRARFHFDERRDPVRELHAVQLSNVQPWLGLGVEIF